VPGTGNSETVVNNDGGDPVSGFFNGLPDGTVFFVGPYSFRIDYDGGDGNDVVITAVSNCNAVTIPTNITSLTGATVNVPLNVDDTTGNGLLSTDLTLTYNTSVLSAPVVSLGTVSAGRTLTVNDTTPGILIISIFGGAPFTGAGTLANVQFTVNGLPGTSSPVAFTSFKFNEGTPCSSTSNGLVTVISGTISGIITYGNVVGLPAAPRFIPSVTVNAVGSVNVSTTTPPAPTSNGFYSLSGMGAGAYTVTPSKVGGVAPLIGSTITSFDSAIIARHVVGFTTPAPQLPLTAAQQTAADVSGAGGITSFDAALIARWVAGLPGSGNTATWVFTPASRNYPNVNGSTGGENYSAILMGDVTGNYDQTLSPARPADSEEGAITVAPPTMSANSGTQVSIPVTVGDMTGSDVLSYQFMMRYDPAVLEPVTGPIGLDGTLSQSYTTVSNVTEPGVLVVVAFGSQPIAGSGTLLNMKFNVIGAWESSSKLTLEHFRVNEGDVNFETKAGSLQVVAATEGVIKGRLLSPAGTALRGMKVTAIDTAGNSRTVMSSSFGVFQIAGLQIGETYTLRVDSKRYRFAAQQISLTGNAAEVDLIAQE